jgi:thiamine biosynthesis lipoprotein
MTVKKQPQSWQRKDFLRIVAAAGILGTAAKLGLEQFQAPVQARESRILMGTVVNLTVLGEDQDRTTAAVRACLDRMEALESVLSRYQPSSQLSLLNREGFLTNPHPALQKVVQAAVHLADQTGGKFDPTVKPLVDLYQKTVQEKHGLPGQEQIQAALELVDFRQVILAGNQIRFQQQGMSLTLDGIAKGFIVQEGLQALQGLGFVDQLVEAGGDLAAGGVNRRGEPWTIGIRNPRKGAQAALSRVQVDNQALATSGDYQQPFGHNFDHHHILDPRRGHSDPELASVTVRAPGAMAADGLATAVMVMGAREGIGFLESQHGVEGLLVTKDGQIMSSSGFEAGRSQDG